MKIFRFQKRLIEFNLRDAVGYKKEAILSIFTGLTLEKL